MTDLIAKIMASQDPSKSVPADANELERIIVIRPPGTTADMIETVSHWQKHRTLENYEGFKVVEEKKRRLNFELSDTFKRLALFEAAGYIAAAYATELKNDDLTGEMVTTLLRAQASLVSDSDEDYSEAYNAIREASDRLAKKGVHLQVSGRAGSAYLVDVPYFLKFCAPDKYEDAINAGFAGRQVRFLIAERGAYQKEIEANPAFAEFAKSYPYHINPVRAILD